MEFKDVLDNIEVWDNWRESYKFFVPKFIEEAISKQNWADWDKDIFNEYFERSANQCVSSLQQGYFTGVEKERIKENWGQIAPLLKKIAESQEVPLFEIYQQIKNTILDSTNSNKEAAIHRMIAGLQPRLLSTVVTYKRLNELYTLLISKCSVDIQDYKYNDWFSDSHQILKLYQDAMPENDSYDIITYPWQTIDYLNNNNTTNHSMQNNNEDIIQLLKYKKQIILQGPPGTGKTRLAKEIATQLVRPVQITADDIKAAIKVGQTIISIADRVPYKVIEVDESGVGLKLENGNVQKRNYSSIIQAYTNLIDQKPLTGGDTYQAAIAKFILDNPDQSLCKFIQFHSSFSYEDFVRGIVAESNGDKIIYRNVNKILGQFAAAALQNFLLSKADNGQALMEKWVDQRFEEFKAEIENEAEHKQVTLSGEIGIFDVESDCFRYGKQWNNPSRIKFSDFKHLIAERIKGNLDITQNRIPKEVSVHAHYRFTYYLALIRIFFEKYSYQASSEKSSLKNYVLIIDEINRGNLSSVLGELIYALEYRGEKVESMYAVDNKNELVLPPNLYIIGTMNTADRSVGHIDYAIRRRFAFANILPRDLSAELGIKFHKVLFGQVASLFDTHLSAEFEKEDMQLGHSYFIDRSDEGGPIDMRLQYEIKPILVEYVKDGVLIGEDIERIIDDLTV